jgi:hypothetical protein
VHPRDDEATPKEDSMKTDVPIKAEVRCDDGVAGTSEAVIVDPLKREITHLVFRERRYPHTERLVPIDLIAWTTEDEVHLRCSIAETKKLDSFLERQSERSTDVGQRYIHDRVTQGEDQLGGRQQRQSHTLARRGDRPGTHPRARPAHLTSTPRPCG